MISRLVLRRADGTMRTFALGASATVGSAAGSDIKVDQEDVSPLHARLTFDDGSYWVEDASSRLGTFVNGLRIEKRQLRHLDVLTIAPGVQLVFQSTQPGSAKVEPVSTARSGVTVAVARPLSSGAMPRFVATIGPTPIAEIEKAGRESHSGGTDTRPPVPRAIPPSPATVVNQVPSLERAINSVRLVGASGTFKTSLGTCIIGRGSDAAIRIDSKEVSRRHARLVIRPGEVTIEDLKSANGTKVNGVRAAGPTVLNDGDTVSFDTFKFRLEIARFDRES